MLQVRAWNPMDCKVDDPSPPMELKEALQLILTYRNRDLRRITLMDTKTGEEFSGLEHFVQDAPEA